MPRTSGSAASRSSGSGKKVAKTPIWQPSDSPEETFSDADGANEDGEWPVEIVGEEVDCFGVVRHEVRWGNWKRADGTNTTWNDSLIDQNLIDSWDSAQLERRLKMAEESTEIRMWSSIDIHNTLTRYRAQAAEEKAARRRREMSSPGWVSMSERTRLHSERIKRAILEEQKEGPMEDSDDDEDQKPHRLPEQQSTSTNRHPPQARSYRSTNVDTVMGEGSSTAPTNRSSKRQSKPSRILRERSALKPTQPRSHPSAPVSRTASSSKGSSTFAFSPPPSSSMSSCTLTSISCHSAGTSADKISKTKRELVTNEWNSVALSSSAAKINFVNDVDDEDVPALPPGFHPSHIHKPDDALLVSCDCKKCLDPAVCECQDITSTVDLLGKKIYAYDKGGLLNFVYLQADTIVECNKNCKCSAKCMNRVAQLPRSVPINIFKTAQYGWGICSPVAIKKGKVIGLYSGQLITRKEAEALDEDSKSYCFDLDSQLDPGTNEYWTNSYSVNSRTSGNWARFLNHSCDPNLYVYPVFFDTIPETNIPSLAFVALRNIPSYEELTVDYDPEGAEEFRAKKKMKRTSDMRQCRCGAADCRKWVKVSLERIFEGGGLCLPSRGGVV